jgi:flavin reductase (DIM6/NTAB) family NADH-FMN oxidoreductase RutF
MDSQTERNLGDAPGKIAELLRLADRTVWIVTAQDGDRRGGLIATFVLQASIDPSRPVAVAALAPNHFTAELVFRSGKLGLHLITADHIDHVWRFAVGSGRDRDKLAGLDLLPSKVGVPLLADCLAWFECQVVHAYPAGDRIFFWADLMAAGRRSEGIPLAESELFRMASPELLSALNRDMIADIERQRPMVESWRSVTKP